MEKIQKFGGAMYTPVMLFAVAGLIIGFGTIFTTPIIIGDIAKEGTNWYNFWNTILEGGWTVFRQLPLLFVVGLPAGLAKKQQGRACMEALAIYLTFNYFLSAILSGWGPLFGIDFTQEVGRASGLANIANIKTLDMGMVGALLISGISIAIHNKYFDTSLPEIIGIFQGAPLVYAIGFVIMIPLAFLSALIWPKVQQGILLLQGVMGSSGIFGVFIFIFLERILIPFGLHHLIYAPVFYDNVLVNGGIRPMWNQMLPEIAGNPAPIIEQAPWASFMATGWSKMFGTIGIALAIYYCAKPENRKKVAGLMIPVTLTAFITGVTEPIEFTFLFIAPFLFLIHSILAACLSTVMVKFGIVGSFGGGLIQSASENWIPLANTHGKEYIPMIIIAIIAIFVWFFVFSFLIKKFNVMTPGRADDNYKLYSKKEYKQKDKKKSNKEDNKYTQLAKEIMVGLGGADNIKDFTNCVTRLRVNVKDIDLVREDNYFKEIGTYGLAKNRNSVHVIVGTNVTHVADVFAELYRSEKGEIYSEYNNYSEQELINENDTFAKNLADEIIIGIGGKENIKSINVDKNVLNVEVKDKAKVQEDVYFKEFVNTVEIDDNKYIFDLNSETESVYKEIMSNK